MKEKQIKPINTEEETTTPEIKQTKKNKKEEFVKSLPTWSIEPPLEIKRGQE